MQNKFVKQCYESDLQFRVHNVSGVDINSAYSSQLHYDTDLTIAYFKKVIGKIRIEGNSYELQGGEIVILNYNELHCVDVNNDFSERITLYIGESIYKNYSEQVNKLLNVFYNRKRGTGNLISASTVKEYGLDVLMEEIKELSAQQDPTSELIAFGKITELLKKFQEIVFEQDNLDFCACTHDPIVDEAIKYIGLHFTQEITCEGIAKEIHLNKYYLGRLFKERVGMSLWDYVINRRLLNFNDLIRQRYTVEEACYMSGFRNYSNFYRLYKSRTGISPKEFKNSIAKK